MLQSIIKSWFYDRLGNPKYPNLSDPMFLGGLGLKILAAMILASDYLRNLFSPFIDQYLATGDDPYSYFIENGKGNEFPYPPVMLFILSIGRIFTWPLGAFDPAHFGMADSLGLRLPVLAADLAIYLVLSRWFRSRQKQVLYFYWLSPLAFYISYMHGQLDVIPMAFLFVSLHYLFRRKLMLSAVLFALAFGCKTHLVLVLPFYLWFLYKNADTRKREIILPFMAMLVITFLIHMSFYSDAYMAMVFRNKVQNQVFDLFYQFNPGLKFLFIPATLMILTGWYFSLRFVNKDQLLLFIGFTFLALTVMIAPMQGWYYWILPFMVFFMLRHGSVNEMRVFVIVNAAYFFYFLMSPESDFARLMDSQGPVLYTYLAELGYPAENLLNIAFTMMQSALVVFAWMVYRNGIRQNIQAKFLSQPYLVGVGGDSSSGKSTLSDALAGLFGSRNAGVVRGDDMHKWERGDENWSLWTHLNPQANRLHENMQQAVHLKKGHKIRRSEYDHHTGTFTLPRFIDPKKLVIFEGLHSFYLRNQADVYDLKIFMYPDEELRKYWKVERDVARRGYEPEKVREQLELRQEDSEKYILVQAAQADIIYRFFAVNSDALAAGDKPVLGLQMRFDNDIYLDPLLEAMDRYERIVISQQYDGDYRLVNFEGTMPFEIIERIAEDLIPELEEVGIYAPEWKDDYSGIMQLMTCYIIFSKLRDNGS